MVPTEFNKLTCDAVKVFSLHEGLLTTCMGTGQKIMEKATHQSNSRQSHILLIVSTHSLSISLPD